MLGLFREYPMVQMNSNLPINARSSFWYFDEKSKQYKVDPPSYVVITVFLYSVFCISSQIFKIFSKV